MILNFFIFSALFISFSYYVFRKTVRRDYQQFKKLSSFSTFLEVLVFVIHANSIYLILPTPWPGLPELPTNWFIRILSLLIFLIGLAILLIAWFGLGTNTSLGKDGHQLNTEGIYRLSRNPQLMAYGIMLLSVVILFFSWLSLLWLSLYFMAAYFMVWSEEEYLEKKYGIEYQDYIDSVPRFL